MAKKKRISKKLKQFSIETWTKSVNIFKDKVVAMFKGYVKTIIACGSIVRGDYQGFTGKSDVDLWDVKN